MSKGRSRGVYLAPGYVLVIAEKPKAAIRIALALSGGRARRFTYKGVPYWVLTYNGERFVVAPAAGHLFGLTTDKRGYPVVDYYWAPLWAINKGAKYTKKFYELLKMLCKGAKEFINACDFDVEGSVIGYMILREFGDLRKARRVKFSSLTSLEIRRAFSSPMHGLDWDMIEAGLCRHELDWLWGINVSRALMEAFKRATGKRIVLSAGRVQSPTLVEAYNSEVERRLHVPTPLFNVAVTVELNGERYTLRLKGGPLSSFEEAKRVANTVRKVGKLTLVSLARSDKTLSPPPPFNLGDLQVEAYRVYGLSPLKTQEIAEDLYLSALISYPRTNNQRLPRDLDYRAVIEALASQPEYRALCLSLLRETGGRLVPVEGVKTDPAHPAIYPTGVRPKGLKGKHKAVYDLIVRRFLAAFAPPALLREVSTEWAAGAYCFTLSIKGLVRSGWTKYYTFHDYTMFKGLELRVGIACKVVRVRLTSTLTRPRRPYSKSTLLKWMESVNIGTEGTRARIMETLFDRGYLRLKGKSIEVTRLGEAVVEVLLDKFPQLSSVDLTRRFEELMMAIRMGKCRREDVIREAKAFILRVTEAFKRVSNEAGFKLALGLGEVEARNPCRLCWRESSGPHGLCKFHEEALRRLRECYKLWVKAIPGITWSEYLERLVKSRSTGAWVKEVAEHLLRHSTWVTL